MNVEYNEYVAIDRMEKGYDEEKQIEEYFRNERDRKGKCLMIDLNEYCTEGNDNYSNMEDSDRRKFFQMICKIMKAIRYMLQ